MIDCGSSTFSRIQKSNLLDGVEHVYVLLTHTHPDHVGSLGDLILYEYYSMGKLAEPNITVFAPYDLTIRHVLKSVGVEEQTYNLCQFEDFAGIHYGDFHLQFEAVPVTHVKELKCFGYIFHFDNQTVYYSGDSKEIPQDILDSLNNGGFDVFYQDTCKADYPGNVHLSLRELDELVELEVRSKVHCMHLDNGFSKQEAEDLGFNVVDSLS
jgi:ribonuclease BN (tRNA processing enzyme)